MVATAMSLRTCVKSKDIQSQIILKHRSLKFYLQTQIILYLKLCFSFIKYIFILPLSYFYDPFYRKKKKFSNKWCLLAVSPCSVLIHSPFPCSLGSIWVIFWLCFNCCPSCQLWFYCGFPLTPLAIPGLFLHQPPLSLPGL